MTRVLITGLGVVAPNGTGVPAFLHALRAGTSGLGFVPEMRAAGLACQVAGIPKGALEGASRFLDERQVQTTDRTCLYAALAALECWADAGFDPQPTPDSAVDWDTSVFVGSGMPGIQSVAEILVPNVQAQRIRQLGSTAPQRCMASGPAALISGLLGIGGTAVAVSNACSSGTQAIAMGFDAIRYGQAKRVLVGGADADSIYAWAGFDAMRVLARDRNDDPQAASRPMSATASGFVPAAGAGFLLLEGEESAAERGARVYAELTGASSNSGGHRGGGSMTAPNGEGIRRCIRRAVALSGIAARDIQAINGHLTGTKADVGEVRAWTEALDLGPASAPSIQATKGLIGHTLGAAGAIESVASVLQISEQFLHTNRNCEDLHPELIRYSAAILERPRNGSIRNIAKASFGFGDVNTCLVFSAA